MSTLLWATLIVGGLLAVVGMLLASTPRPLLAFALFFGGVGLAGEAQGLLLYYASAR